MDRMLVILLVWMAASSREILLADAFLLTTAANSLLSKFIKVPVEPQQQQQQSSSSMPAPATFPSANSAKVFGPSVVNGYRIEIPVYEATHPSAVESSSSAVAWDSKNTAAPISPYWTYPNSNVPQQQQQPSQSQQQQQYEVHPVLNYLHQSLSWPSTLLSSYIADQMAESEGTVQWPPQPSASSSSLPVSSSSSASPLGTISNSAPSSPLLPAASYQYPIYLPSPSMTTRSPSSSLSAANSVYLIGKHNKNFLIPPATTKTQSGQLPLSLIALSNGAPQDMLSMAEDKRYEMKHRGPGSYSKRFYDDQKTFYRHQTDHLSDHTGSSALTPFSETRTFEQFQHENQPNWNQNVYYQRHNQQQQMPLNIFDQYPYYLEDAFNNFDALLDSDKAQNTPFSSSPQHNQHHYEDKYAALSSNNNNWPHKSKYEPINHSRRKKSQNNNNNKRQSRPHSASSPSKNNGSSHNKKDNCTDKQTKQKPSRENNKQHMKSSPSYEKFKIIKHDEQTHFRPILPKNSKNDYYESLRKRSGYLEKKLSSENRTDDGGSSTQTPILPLEWVDDNLMTAHSVNKQMKVKLNEIDDNGDGGDKEQHQSHDDNSDTDDNASETDREKSGEQEAHRNEDGESVSRDEAVDSGDGEGGGNYDKERRKWLKDKGYAKHGWKNVYHKEEWGEAKKYHDVWRFKDWKDRYAEKVPSASDLVESLSSEPTSENAVETDESGTVAANSTILNEIPHTNLSSSKNFHFDPSSDNSNNDKWIPIKYV